MNNDELQVLGTEKKPRKKNKLTISIIVLIVFGLGIGLLAYLYSLQPEKIKTGKKMGDPTIVPELQEAVDSFLMAEMEEIGATQGQTIVMDVQTGEIVAMVGLEINFEKKYQPCKNFAYQQDMGSVMKTVSLLAALETGKVKLSDEVNVGIGIHALNNDIVMRDHNWHRGGYGVISVAKALMVSSNIGICKAVDKAFGKNQQQFYDMLDKMGYGQPDSIEGIVGLKPTTYNSPKDSDWVNYNMWWSAIGYDRKIAPIQVLTFYNAIANDGKMVKPTLKTGVVEIINPQIASKASIDSIQVVLERVVSEGLGKRAGTPLLLVAGKTGTSEVAEYYYGDNSVAEYQLAFCGYFPADKPKYSMIVSINKIGLPASGGFMAGQVFHNIVEWMIKHGMVSPTGQ